MTTVYNKNGIEFDIDAIATDLNGKMDKDGVNAECPTLLSRTPNNQGGVVEIWSDGYCVQTGILNSSTWNSGAIIFPTPFVDANYIITATCTAYNNPDNNLAYVSYYNTSKTKNGITLTTCGEYNGGMSGSYGNGAFINWRAEGYIR